MSDEKICVSVVGPDERAREVCALVEPWLSHVDASVEIAVEAADADITICLEDADNHFDEYSHCDPDVRILDASKPLSVLKHKAINAVKAKIHGNDNPDSRDGTESSERTYADAIRSQSSDNGAREVR